MSKNGGRAPCLSAERASWQPSVEVTATGLPVKRYNEYLRDLIITDTAKPSRIISHRIRIDDAPDAYDKFDKRVEGYTKVLIKFEKAA